MTLFALIIESYLSILLAVGGIASFMFAIGLYFIFRNTPAKSGNTLSSIIPAPHQSKRNEKFLLPDTANDVTPISGEDPMATQLDLARAYIETGKKQFARIILATVIREGSGSHQEEAQRLLSSI